MQALAPLLGSMAAGAQSGGSARDLVPLFMWIGLAVVVLVIAGIVVMAVRRRMLSGVDASAGEATLMQDLRDMRDRGEISDEEFRSIRATMVERAKASMDAASDAAFGAAGSKSPADRRSGASRDPGAF